MVAKAVLVLRPWLEDSADAVIVMVEVRSTRVPVADAEIGGTVKTSPFLNVVV